MKRLLLFILACGVAGEPLANAQINISAYLSPLGIGLQIGQSQVASANGVVKQTIYDANGKEVTTSQWTVTPNGSGAAALPDQSGTSRFDLYGQATTNPLGLLGYLLGLTTTYYQYLSSTTVGVVCPQGQITLKAADTNGAILYDGVSTYDISTTISLPTGVAPDPKGSFQLVRTGDPELFRVRQSEPPQLRLECLRHHRLDAKRHGPGAGEQLRLGDLDAELHR